MRTRTTRSIGVVYHNSGTGYSPKIFLRIFLDSTTNERMGTRHPAAGELDSLSLGLLKRADSCRLQRHLYKCASCLERLVAIETAAGRTPRQLQPAPTTNTPVAFIHDTADGPFHSQSEPYLGIWRGRHWGKRLYGMRVCKSISEANEYLILSFTQLFPEHRCTERCRIESGPLEAS